MTKLKVLKNGKVIDIEISKEAEKELEELTEKICGKCPIKDDNCKYRCKIRC